MSSNNLFISPELLNKVQEHSNPLLNVPSDAKPGRGDSYRWAEVLTISAVSIGSADKGRTEVLVRFRVSMASPNVSNRGKSTRLRCLLNTAAAEGTGDHTMTIISLSNLRALVAAVAGEEAISEGLDLGMFFSDGSPLLNQDVITTVTDKPDRDDPSIRRQELGRFTSAI